MRTRYLMKNFTVEQLDLIETMSQDPELYRNLAKSIAPTVCGHEEVKRGVLL